MRDLRFGDVQIFRTPQNKLILVKTLWCNNEHEYNQCLRKQSNYRQTTAKSAPNFPTPT